MTHWPDTTGGGVRGVPAAAAELALEDPPLDHRPQQGRGVHRARELAHIHLLCLGPQVHRWTPEAQQWLFSNPLFEWRIAGYRDIREAAGMLGVSIECVRDREADRRLPTDREFSRLRRVTALADLKGRWVAWQRAKPPE